MGAPITIEAVREALEDARWGHKRARGNICGNSECEQDWPCPTERLARVAELVVWWHDHPWSLTAIREHAEFAAWKRSGQMMDVFDDPLTALAEARKNDGR